MAPVPPFPNVDIFYIVFLVIGALLATVILGFIYIRRLHRELKQMNPDHEKQAYNNGVGSIGLSKKAEDVLKEVVTGPELQSDLPQVLDRSKTTISHAVSELDERGLIKRKKKAQTYLIEPDMDAIDRETSSGGSLLDA